MKYVIPVRPMKDHKHSEQFEEALKKFVTKRIGYNSTFEVFNSVDSRTDALQQVNPTILITYDFVQLIQETAIRVLVFPEPLILTTKLVPTS